MIRRIGKIQRIGKLKPMRARGPKIRAPGPDMPRTDKLLDLEPSDIKDLRRLLGDDPETERLIKRVLKIKAREPRASLPELIAYDWLTRNDIQFSYQGTAYGGRMFRGGQIPDFVIPQGGMALCWRIQGEYWHTLPGAQEKDLINKLALLAGTVDGLRVSAVVDIWEDDVYRQRERVFRLAMAGTGLRE